MSITDTVRETDSRLGASCTHCFEDIEIGAAYRDPEHVVWLGARAPAYCDEGCYDAAHGL